MVQPIEGLVVSIPVLVDAQCMKRQPPSAQQKLLELCPEVETKGKDGSAQRRVADLPRFLSELLELTPDLFDTGDTLPEELSLYVPEGKQVIRPTMALRKRTPEEDAPATKAGSKYVMLVWELPDGLLFDKAETVTGPWDYPPAASFSGTQELTSESVARDQAVEVRRTSRTRRRLVLHAAHAKRDPSTE